MLRLKALFRARAIRTPGTSNFEDRVRQILKVERKLPTVEILARQPYGRRP